MGEGGIFVGVKTRHEAILVNEEGIVQARDVMRMPLGYRLSEDCVK